MRSSDLSKAWSSAKIVVNNRYCGLLVCVIALGLLAFAAGVATGEYSHRNSPAAVTGVANAYSGGGNLVPLF